MSSAPNRRAPAPDGDRPVPKTPECAPAREALADGDYRSARALALGVLSSEKTPPPARREAEEVLEATEIPRAPLAAGLACAALLAVLFLYLVLQGT